MNIAHYNENGFPTVGDKALCGHVFDDAPRTEGELVKCERCEYILSRKGMWSRRGYAPVDQRVS